MIPTGLPGVPTHGSIIYRKAWVGRLVQGLEWTRGSSVLQQKYHPLFNGTNEKVSVGN